MELKKNDIVILKPLEQIPGYKNINIDIYNKYQGKLLIVSNIYISPIINKKYYTYRTFYSSNISYDLSFNEFTGPEDISIKFNDGI